MKLSQIRAVLIAGALIGTLQFPSSAGAENWPGWRGPRGDGTCTEKDVPKRWDVAAAAVWKIQVLLGYAARYRSYPYHDAQLRTGSKASRAGGYLFEQTLNEASAMAGTIAPAYDLIRGAASLSADDHRAIREGLLRPMLENIAKHKAGKSNWQSWHNAALLWGGAVLSEEDYVRRAIDDPQNGFLHQMQISVSDEGMWYENSWGHHLATHLTLAAAPGTQVRTGDGVGGSVLELFPLAMITHRGTQAAFAAVLEPLPGDQPPAVASIEIQAVNGGTEIKVHRAGELDVLHLNVAGELRVLSDGQSLLQLTRR